MNEWWMQMILHRALWISLWVWIWRVSIKHLLEILGWFVRQSSLYWLALIQSEKRNLLESNDNLQSLLTAWCRGSDVGLQNQFWSTFVCRKCNKSNVCMWLSACSSPNWCMLDADSFIGVKDWIEGETWHCFFFVLLTEWIQACCVVVITSSSWYWGFAYLVDAHVYM